MILPFPGIMYCANFPGLVFHQQILVVKTLLIAFFCTFQNIVEKICRNFCINNGIFCIFSYYINFSSNVC